MTELLKTVEENLILDVHEVFRDEDGSLCCVCPHCEDIIALDGHDLEDVQGEQYQHLRRSFPSGYGHTRHIGCDGWMQISSTARRVKASS